MYKVYLLLRNNLQSGPHDLDELLKHDLKSTDLVWEEGKSGGWSYPFEIESLKPFVQTLAPSKHKSTPSQKDPASNVKKDEGLPTLNMDAPFASKNVTSKNVYVSLPGHSSYKEETKESNSVETIEQKADAIRRRALAAADQKNVPLNEVVPTTNFELETKVQKTTSEIGEDYSAWLYTQKIEKKKKAHKRRSILMGVSSVFLISLAILLILNKEIFFVAGEGITDKTLSNPQKATQERKVLKDTQVVLVSAPVVEEQSTDSLTQTGNTTEKSITPAKKEIVKNNKVTSSTLKDTFQPVQSPIHDEENQNVVTISNQTNAEAPANDNIAVQPRQKEKIGSKIGNLFGWNKKKGNKESPSNNQSGKENTSSGERISRKRDQSVSPAPNIINQVSISANATPGNWMMGVQGLKLTLQNKSNEVLKFATVEVRYYNEDKELIDKKLVQFNNVPAKRSQTIAAPDHRLADHADYQLISAVAKEDAVVKQ